MNIEPSTLTPATGQHHTISFSDGMPVWHSADGAAAAAAPKQVVGVDDVCCVRAYAWVAGSRLDARDFEAYSIDVSQSFSHAGQHYVDDDGTKVAAGQQRRETVWER